MFNKHGDLLLQKRSSLKDQHPGVWDSSVSGHLDSGESYEAAAIRELSEEMGISAEFAPEEILKFSARAETGWEHIRLYRVRYDGSLRFPSAEIETVMWFPLSELEQWIERRPADFAPGFLHCWQNFRSIP